MSNRRKISNLATSVLLGFMLTGCASADSTEVLVPNQTSQPVEAEQPVTPESQIPAPDEKSEPSEPLEETPQQEAENLDDTANIDEPIQQPGSEQLLEAIPLSEVQANDSRDSCWIVLVENVYDFTMFVQQHPFGAQLSRAVCGQDATEMFQENTEIDEVIEQLEQVLLGPLK